MNFIADFHIHSHYSLATSKLLTPQHLDYWAKIKGVNLVGTGDFTHPKWTAELSEQIEPSEPGLFKLKKEFEIPNNPLNNKQMRFLLSAEISNIYKKNGKVRKVHNIVLAPDFKTVERIQNELQNRKFNITSDGRPILGLDSRDLLELLLEINQEIFFIPAHIWTPWFAALGSKSGFDTIDECYGDLTPHIHAVETGLSSDQPLNWLCSFLDKFSLLSNSDAHSPEKLGRNANIFNTELSYYSIIEALKNQQTNDFVGTIDMYPQEGKYHFDGHRKCEVCFSPTETMENKGVCPKCGNPLTLGVAHRIAQLADRDNPEERPFKKEIKYVIPLKEIIAEIKGVSPNTKTVDNIYHQTINDLGSEFDILLNKDIDEIKQKGGEFLSVAIDRMRSGNVILKEGYDGEYGTVKLFDKSEIKNYGSKKSLFDTEGELVTREYKQRKLLNFDVAKFRILKKDVNIEELQNKIQTIDTENTEQKDAIETESKNSLIIAGPGTGKTRVLTERIKFLIENKKIKPEKVWAVTFSNQAALELKSRIRNLLNVDVSNKIKISTFHAFGLEIITMHKGNSPVIINENDKKFILSKFDIPNNQIKSTIAEISLLKNTLNFGNISAENLNIFNKYNEFLHENNFVDFDDLIYEVLNLFKQKSGFAQLIDFEHILIDEFQDINNAQYQLISQISKDNTNIFAIGDPNQSIYGFRGSDVSLIQKYISDFQAQELSLSKSYRCTNNILFASNDVVKNEKSLTGLSKGLKINIAEQPTDRSEAEFIARTIEDMIGGLRFFSMDSRVTEGSENKEISGLSDFAILVRTKSQFDAITKGLNDHSIPYQIVGTKSFLAEKPFIQITTILKSLAYSENVIFKEQADKITKSSLNYDENSDLSNLITSIWEQFFKEKHEKSAKKFEKYLKLAENKSLIDFLTDIEQLSGQDDLNTEIEAVKLMTLHASKGLEFQCVFIPGVEDGILPYKLFKKEVDADEERRLLYVGMTRAKKFLYLTHAKSRKLNNLMYNLKRSSFIDNIKKSLLQQKKQVFKRKKDDTQLSLF